MSPVVESGVFEGRSEKRNRANDVELLSSQPKLLGNCTRRS